MGNTFSQFFPSAPSLTERNLPPQTGKVFIVTGGAAGVGFALCQILYQAGAKVYLAGRSESNAAAAISNIKSSTPKVSGGELHFLYLDLSDLTTINSAVESFMGKEKRLDVLFNNAGVSQPPRGSVSAQNHDLQMATNCLGPYLFTQLLLPILTSTASVSPPASVRVIWTSSIVCEFQPKPIGLSPSDLSLSKLLKNDPQTNYTLSKTGNYFLASTLSDRVSRLNILSLTQNPGNLKTSLTRHFPWWLPYLVAPLLYEATFGAYTELWAGLSEELGMGDGGTYVVPWGKRHVGMRADLVKACKGREEGGTGEAKDFEGWCEEMVKEFR